MSQCTSDQILFSFSNKNTTLDKKEYHLTLWSSWIRTVWYRGIKLFDSAADLGVNATWNCDALLHRREIRLSSLRHQMINKIQLDGHFCRFRNWKFDGRGRSSGKSVRWILWKALQSGRALLVFRWEDYYIVTWLILILILWILMIHW